MSWRRFLIGAVLVSVFVAVQATADDLDVAALRERVAALEAQNHSMRAELDALKARLPPPSPALAPPVPATSSSPPSEVRIGESRVGFYGFVRVDAIYDDSRPSAFQTPLFILSEDPRTGLRDNENFTLHPRLTRFGMNFNGPHAAPLHDAALSGKIEIDFQNGGRESRAISRFRHAYLQLSWPHSSLLIGQTSDVISPLFPSVNADTLMWNTGNLGDRRPQIRYRQQSANGRLTYETALGLTGAVDAQDLDLDDVRDGEASALPDVQARIGFQSVRKDFWSVGVWGHRAWQTTTKPIAGRKHFNGDSLGLDYKLAFASRARIQGEVWRGTALGDFRGGIGQSVNTTTGNVIASRGGWSEIGFDVVPRSSLYFGYTLDDPDDADVPTSGKTRNSAWYISDRLRFGAPFLLGLEYLRWTTRYRGLAEGLDNRFNVYVIYNF